MSTTIDERVVEMKFDNSLFESAVQKTLGTLDKLKSALKLDGAAKGLESINASAQGMNFGPAQAAVEGLTHKFSIMEEFASGAIRNIANDVTNKLKGAINSVTLEPIMTGFSEYETQMNAVQTILANTQSKGEDITSVNAALNELNHYADQTIYNFTQMTDNIGRFTAAGVDLDVATESIKGISNLAALSGSNAQQASTAMYQLSQAMSSGALKLQDWNSVVNAGMGGEAFQNALKQTSRAMYELTDRYLKLANQGKSTAEIADELGISLEKAQQIAEKPYPDINVDKAIESAGSFRESLKEGWITSEVLSETLQNLTYDYKEVGDAQYEEAKATLLANGYLEDEVDAILQLSHSANEAATKVKTISQLWDTLKEAVQSGWTQTWQYIIGDFEEAKELLSGASDALNEIVGKSAETRNAFWKVFHDEGGRASAIEALTSAFNALMGVITPVSKAISTLFPKVTAEQLNIFCAGLAIAAKNLEILVTSHQAEIEAFTMSIVSPIKAILTLGGQVLKFFGGKIISVIKGFFGLLVDVGGFVYDFARAFSETMFVLSDSGKIVNVAGEAWWGFMTLFEEVEYQIRTFFETIRNSDTFKEFAKVAGVVAKQLAIIAGSAIAGGLLLLADLFISLSGAIHDLVVNFVDFSKNVIGQLKKSVAFQTFSSQIAPLNKNLGSLSETVLGFSSTVKKNLSGTFTTAIDNVKAFFGSFIKLPSARTVSQFIGRILLIISNLIGLVKGGAGSIKEFFASLAIKPNVGRSATGVLEQIKAKLSSFKDALVNVFSGTGGAKEGISKRFAELFEGIDISNLNIGEKLSKLGEGITKAFENWNLDTLFDAAKAGSLAYFLIKIGGFFKSVKGLTKQTKSFVDGCKGMVDSMSGVFDATAKQMNADALKHMAEAVGIIAAAVFALGFMDEDALARSALVIGMIIYLLTRLSDGTKKADIKEAAVDKMDGVKDGINDFLDGMKDAFAKAAKLVGMAAIVVALGVTVGILVICIHSLAKLNKDGGLLAAWMGVIQVAALIAALTAAIIAISKFAGDKKGLKATLIIASMASAVKKLTKSVEVMSRIPIKALKRGVLAVLVLMAAIGKLSVVSKENELTSLGFGMTLIASALSLLMIPLTIMGNMDIAKLSQGGFAIIVLLSVMTALGALASDSIDGAASILIVSAAIVLLVPALIALGVAAPVALVGLLSLAAAFVVFAAGGALLTFVAPALLITATALAITTVALLAAGAGFTLIIAGMAAFAGSLAILGAALPGFANGIVAFSNTISANAANIQNGFLALILSISQALLIGVPTIMITVRAVVAAVVIGLCLAIQDAVNPIVDTILVAFVAILNGLAKYSGAIFDAVINIAISLIRSIVKGVDSLLEWVREHGINQLSRIFFSLEVFVASAVKGFVDSIAAMGIPIISGLAEDIGGHLDTFVDNVEKKIDEIDLKEAVVEKFDETAEGVEEGKNSVESATSGLGETLKSGFSSMFSREEGTSAATDYTSGLTAAFSNGAPDFQAALSQYTGGEGGMGLLGDMNAKGTTDGTDYTAGLTSSIAAGGPDFQAALSQYTGGGEGGTGFLGDMTAKGAADGESYTTGLSTSFTEGAPTVQAAADNLITFNTEDMTAKAAEHGKCIDDGVAQGIKDNSTVATDAVTETSNALVTASADTLGIHSPSTKFAEHGKNIDEGYAQGIKDNQNKVTTAITTMLSTAQRSVTSQTTKFKTEGGKIPTNFASGISGGIEKVKTAATKMATTASTAAGSKETEFKTAGTNSVTKFADGLGSKNEDIQNKGVSAADSFVTGINSKAGSASSAGSSLASNAVSGAATRNAHNRYTTTFYSVGQDAADGFTAGINSKAKAAADAAAKMAADALNSAKTTINSNSPSKEFMKLGEYSSEGFAIGMTNLTGMVAESSRSVAQSAIDSVTGAVKRFNTLSSDDASLKPVISPVIDTSSAIRNIRGLNRAVSLAEGMATTAKISENVEASYTVNNDQAEMQAMMKGMYAYMAEYFPQFASNKYAVLPESTVNGLTRTINRRLGAQLL